MNSVIQEDIRYILKGGFHWEKFRNTTVLITGASGMLASYIVFLLWYLNETINGFNVHIVVLCRNKEKISGKFPEMINSPLFTVVCQDVTDKIEINGGVDYVIHAASPASSKYYGTDPVGVFSANIFGTRNLLELARVKESKGFLFLSSGDAAGIVRKKIISETDIGLIDPMDVRSCYAESKKVGEMMCKYWHYQYGLPTFAVRPEHVFGPTMDLESDDRVCANFISDVLNNRNIRIKSDGLAERTFCYIADATDGFLRVLLGGNPGETYNIGNMNGKISIKHLAEILLALVPEKKLKVCYEKRKATDAYIENKDVLRPILSTEKIEKLGFKCKYSLKEGLRRTLKSFKV